MNEKAYSVMEWWRRHTSHGSDGKPRFEAFPAWGKLVQMIALCCPSSAAAERVFSLLKLCLSKLKQNKLGDDVESSMLMRGNDIDM